MGLLKLLEFLATDRYQATAHPTLSSIQSKDDTVSTVVEVATTRFDAHVRTVLERYYTYIVESIIVRVASSYCCLNERLRGE